MGEVGSLLSQLLELEHRALQHSAGGQPLARVLDGLLVGLERLMPGALASVLTVDAAKTALVTCAAPSLPRAFLEAIEPVKIAEGMGSCGTAAARRTQVAVDDIAHDRLWSGYEQLAAQHGLAACWSTPFFSPSQELLGTFAVYYREVRSPRAADLELIRAAERSVALIIEHDHLWTDASLAKSRFETIFRSSGEALILLDADGRYIDANEAATQLTGYNIDELKHMGLGGLSTDPRLAAIPWRSAQQRSWHGDATIRRKDGTPVPVEARLTRVTLPGGDAWLASIRDAIQRRELEELRRDFLGVLAHELRNPLGAISLSANLLKRKAGPDVQPAMERIIRQTEQLNRLVGDMLDAHQLDSGRLRLELMETDLVALACNCIDENADPDQRATLEAPARLMGTWDADRICQVLRNLISNAIKYGDRSPVTVRIEAVPNGARIKVIDQGPGIPPDALPHVFERFYRAPGASKRARGFGVGLHVCKQLVEAHQGALAVESKLGEGTTFTIDLPLTARAGLRDSP